MNSIWWVHLSESHLMDLIQVHVETMERAIRKLQKKLNSSSDSELQNENKLRKTKTIE